MLEELIQKLKSKTSDDLVLFAWAITTDVRLLKPTLVSECNECLLLKLYLSLTEIDFIGNIVLFFCQRIKVIRRFNPAFLILEIDISVKPVIDQDCKASDAIHRNGRTVMISWLNLQALKGEIHYVHHCAHRTKLLNQLLTCVYLNLSPLLFELGLIKGSFVVK